MTKSLLIAIVAALLLATGFGSALKTAKEANAAKQRITSKQKRLQDLEALRAKQFRYTDLDRSALGDPTPMRKLTEVYLENVPVRVGAPKTTELDPDSGWSRRTVVVTIENLAWERLAAFLHQVGNQPHPWRITGYELAPGTSDGGSGTVTFETLEKRRAAN